MDTDINSHADETVMESYANSSLHNNASDVWPIDSHAAGGDPQATAHSSAVRFWSVVIGTVRLMPNAMLNIINRAKHQPHITPSRGLS